jgi:Dolichyl-phosphate-mannose-protein mannosyltransferase
VSSDNTQHRLGPTPALLLTALIIVALALRFWRIGDWNFEATEMFTLRDSIHLRLTNPRPLSYLLNYYLVRPFMPLDEFGLRLLPAVFGVLAIPAFYFVSRRLTGSRAALFSTLLLTFNELHVYYSQFARYWSLVFLLCAVYPYAIYVGIRERDRRALAFGFVTGILAALAHPVSVLLIGGPAIWFLATYLRPRHFRTLWQRREFRIGVALAAVLLVVVLVRFVPILQGWIFAHDTNPGSGQFLLRGRMAPGLKQFFYVVAYVESLTIPLVLSAMVGVYLLWQGRDRFLAIFLTSLALFPITFLTLLSLRTPVSTYYLLPTAPVFFIGAGVFFDRLAEVEWGLRPRWLLPVTVAAMVIAAGAPTLISQYRNGRRYDFRGVARWIGTRRTASDIVFSDQPMVLAYYLPGTQVERLRYDTIPLARSLHDIQQRSREGALWIVAPTPSHSLRTTLKQGGLSDWIYDHCRLRNIIGTGRIDFRQQYLQVHRCPWTLPDSVGSGLTHAGSEATIRHSEMGGASRRPLRASISR